MLNSLPLNQIVCADCLTATQSWPEGSVDCVVTDPPYGLEFMGKDWDRAVPGVVVDPFCGSGTTCLAAAMLGRNWVGIELDGMYCRLAEGRLADYRVKLG